MKTIVIAGHPDLKHSVANAAILDELGRAFPGMTVRKLCECRSNLVCEREV